MRRISSFIDHLVVLNTLFLFLSPISSTFRTAPFPSAFSPNPRHLRNVVFGLPTRFTSIESRLTAASNSSSSFADQIDNISPSSNSTINCNYASIRANKPFPHKAPCFHPFRWRPRSTLDAQQFLTTFTEQRSDVSKEEATTKSDLSPHIFEATQQEGKVGMAPDEGVKHTGDSNNIPESGGQINERNRLQRSLRHRESSNSGIYSDRSEQTYNARKIGVHTPENEGEQIILNDTPNELRNGVTTFVGECRLPTHMGSATVRAYHHIISRTSPSDSFDVLAIFGDRRPSGEVYVRVHDQCLTSEVFGSRRCDCKEQLDRSLQMVQNDNGLLIYLLQEGRGIGLANKIAAYGLQDSGFDTVDANRHLGFGDDTRSYGAVPFILRDLNINSVKLITNNPMKLKKLRDLKVDVSELVPLRVKPNAHNEKYLRTKQERMAHLLGIDRHSVDCEAGHFHSGNDLPPSEIQEKTLPAHHNTQEQSYPTISANPA